MIKLDDLLFQTNDAFVIENAPPVLHLAHSQSIRPHWFPNRRLAGFGQIPPLWADRMIPLCHRSSSRYRITFPALACIAMAGLHTVWSETGLAAETAVETLLAPVGNAPKTLFGWSIGTETGEADEDDDSIVTDRPHFSEASSLVGKDRIQIESGYSYSGDTSSVSPLFGAPPSNQRVQTHSFPETLLRAGLFAEWFEFRLAYNFLVEQTDVTGQASSTFRGSDDLYIGAKLGLVEQRGWLPEIALFPQAVLPTGDSHFTNEQVLPGFNLAYSWKINDFIELESNTQLNRRRDDAAHFYTEFIQTANVEYTFTKKLGGFTEWFCLIPNGAIAALPQHYFHAGFVYLITKYVQYDIHAAVGLNKSSDDYFVGTGLSVKF